MEIKLSKEAFSGVKLMVCVPMYGGQCYGSFMKSCLDLQNACVQYGIEIKFSFLFSESLINRARNYLAANFMDSDCTHLLFLDADIAFSNPLDFLAMIYLDKDIIGAPYPKKSLNWERIKKAVLKNPKIEAGELPKIAGDIVFNLYGDTTKFNISEPVRVTEIGTGTMLIKRATFEKFKESYPEFSYRPDHIGMQGFDGSREIMSYFNIEINPETRRLESEDYNWCNKCRAVGLEVWIAPWIQIQHSGYYIYQGSIPAIATHVGSLD